MIQPGRVTSDQVLQLQHLTLLICKAGVLTRPQSPCGLTELKQAKVLSLGIWQVLDTSMGSRLITSTKQNEASSKAMKMWDVVQKQSLDNSDQADQGRLPGGRGSSPPFQDSAQCHFLQEDFCACSAGSGPSTGLPPAPGASSLTLQPALGYKSL